jgi:hypothetical protein
MAALRRTPISTVAPRVVKKHSWRCSAIPTIFDGILGGAPANNFVPLLSEQTYNATQVTNPNNPNGFIPSSALPAVTNAVQTACANAKTVPTDNFLGNPTQCKFNPQTRFASFLTPAQITALRQCL